MGTGWCILADGTGCGLPGTGRSGRGPQVQSTLCHVPSESHLLCNLGRSGSSAQASALAPGRGWAGTSWVHSEPGSSGRSIGDKDWSWTGSWPPPHKAAPHTHSLGRVPRMTGWSAESRAGRHHPREGMTPGRFWTLWGGGVGGAGQGGEVTWPADGAALPRWGVALQAVEL